MSILIKGMKIPQGCFSTDGICFAYGAECHCRLVPDKIIHFSTRVKNERPLWCPLIELPPHGDLIDRSKLAWTPIDITDLPYKECLPVYLKEDVDSAPIVIESEET